MNIEQIFQQLHHSIDGYHERPQQIEMAEAVAAVTSGALQEEPDHAVVAIEAPTGVGKTLGYLAGGIAAMVSEDHKLVISTATINLQDQIIHKDLPQLLKSTRLQNRFALAKGRGRYLCTMRLDDLLVSSSQQEIEALSENVLSLSHARHHATLKKMSQQLEDEEWDGDLDHWPQQLPTALLREVTNSREGCLGRRCNRFDGCPFYTMRNRVMEADIVVANHALVLQDLALGGGIILPPPEESVHIVDEAHQLHKSARAAFSGVSDLAQLKQLGTDLMQLLNKLSAISPSTKQLDFGKINRTLHDLTRIAETLEMELNADGKLIEALQENRLEHRLPENHPWRQQMVTHGRSVAGILSRVYKIFEDVAHWIQEDFDSGKMSRKMLNRFKPMVGVALQDLLQHQQCWQQFLAEESPEEPPIARWIELHEGDYGLHIVVNTTPVSVAALLRTLFWEKAAGTVLTSATLRALGNFNLLSEQLGLSHHHPSQMRVVHSPFNYQQQASVKVPWLEVTPENPEQYLQLLPAAIEQAVDHREGALLLFTSRAAMEQCYRALSPRLRKISLVQGGAHSPEEMVRVHRQRIEQGVGSLLIGLNRFAEGVDLPGELCTHVVITRLPFPYFERPVEKSEAEWLTRTGRNPFAERSLPEASIRLIQMAGRLLRTESDRGRITILDRRIVLKRYGRQLLNSLPPYQRKLTVSRPYQSKRAP